MRRGQRSPWTPRCQECPKKPPFSHPRLFPARNTQRRELGTELGYPQGPHLIDPRGLGRGSGSAVRE